MGKNAKSFLFIMGAAAVGMVVGAPILRKVLPESLQDDLLS